MPITIHCPHDKTELKLKDDNKGPEGLLECPKCGCTFRVCLATFDRECFSKVHPKTEWKSDKDIQMNIRETLQKKGEGMDIQDDFPAIPEKRKRGRPPKNVEKVEENAT